MKYILAVALLVIITAANSLATEATPTNARAENSPDSQGCLSRLSSEGWPLPSQDAWRQSPVTTTECGSEITVSYWGFVAKDGTDSCGYMCGPCVSDKIVGQVIYHCDGTTTEWGLTNCGQTTTTYVRCGTCGPGGGPGGGVN